MHIESYGSAIAMSADSAFRGHSAIKPCRAVEFDR
jgi:hypothetical protein